MWKYNYHINYSKIFLKDIKWKSRKQLAGYKQALIKASTVDRQFVSAFSQPSANRLRVHIRNYNHKIMRF